MMRKVGMGSLKGLEGTEGLADVKTLNNAMGSREECMTIGTEDELGYLRGEELIEACIGRVHPGEL